MVFTLALSVLTNENKSQAKTALEGLLGYVLVKYKPDKMLFPGESQRYHPAKWKTALLYVTIRLSASGKCLLIHIWELWHGTHFN